jgi:hypothetical protein
MLKIHMPFQGGVYGGILTNMVAERSQQGLAASGGEPGRDTIKYARPRAYSADFAPRVGLFLQVRIHSHTSCFPGE